MERPGINFLIILIWFQTFILLFYNSKLFSLKYAIKHYIPFFLFSDTLMCIAVFLMCKYINDSHMFYPFIYTLVLQIILCLFLFSGNGYSKILYILFTNILYNMILLLSIMTAKLFYSYVAEYISLYNLKIVTNIVFEFVFFLILWPITKFALKSQVYVYLSSIFWYIIYVIFFFLYFGIVYITDAISSLNAVTIFTVLFEFGLIIICIFIYITFTLLCRSYQEKIQYMLAQQQYEMQKKHLTELSQLNSDTRKLRHELKNTVFYMNYLINKNAYQELLQYFHNFYENEYHTLIESSSSTSIIDAILHQKIVLAQKSHINVESCISSDFPSNISEWDLCILLSNLLDNAIEACSNIEKSKIQIQIKTVKQYLTIVIKNTTEHDVLQKNPHLNSNKKTKGIHGIGIKVVQEIVTKYNGSINFESTPSLFTVKLMLSTNTTGGLL